MLVTPHSYDPMTDDDKWMPFEDCLGALDGSYVDVHVSRKLHGRYRNIKGKITVNVFAACNQDTNFTHVLSGWEGSAADSRVLKDAIHRPNGFGVPVGNIIWLTTDTQMAKVFLFHFVACVIT